MNATYFQATSIGRDRNPKTGAIEIRGLKVALMRPRDDDENTLWLEDETVEEERFGRDQVDAAASWLVSRGCSPGEASRIILTGMAYMVAQSTGVEPTVAETIMESI